MRRFWWIVIVVVVVVVVAIAVSGWAAAGETRAPKAGGEPKSAPKYFGSGGAPGAASVGLYSLPGFWMLAQENIQKELQLTDDQKEKLLAIAKKYQAESRQDWAEISKLPQEKQQERLAELREKTAKRTAEVRKEANAVLLPPQLERLKEIRFRLQAAAMLQNPNTLEQLGITPEQKEQLRQLREEFQRKIQELQQENTAKALKVLTPEQQEKLKEMPAPGF